MGIKIINDDYFYFETEFERQTLKPGTDLIILHKKFGDEYEFENYSYIGNDGEEVILEDEDPTDDGYADNFNIETDIIIIGLQELYFYNVLKTVHEFNIYIKYNK